MQTPTKLLQLFHVQNKKKKVFFPSALQHSDKTQYSLHGDMRRSYTLPGGNCMKTEREMLHFYKHEAKQKHTTK